MEGNPMKGAPHRRRSIRIKSILVPTDFSPTSKAVLEYAIALAQRFAAKIVLVFVVDTAGLAVPHADAAPAAPFWLSELRRSGTLALAKAARDLKRRRLRLETRLCTGVPSQEIARLAQALGTQLIVMGTHGRSGFSRLLLGSVAEKVVRLAPCAVLTIPRAARATRSRRGR